MFLVTLWFRLVFVLVCFPAWASCVASIHGMSSRMAFPC